jgi:hypothetical protein
MSLNGLAFEKQLSEEFQDPKDSEQLYYDLVQILLKLILSHKSHGQYDVAQRIRYLNTILNLLADYWCPNSQLAEMICDFLK